MMSIESQEETPQRRLAYLLLGLQGYQFALQDQGEMIKALEIYETFVKPLADFHYSLQNKDANAALELFNTISEKVENRVSGATFAFIQYGRKRLNGQA